MRFALICAAVVITAGVLAGPAAADPPVRVTQTIVVDEPQVWGVCPSGPVLQTFTIQRTRTTFTDSAGNVVRVVRHATIPGLLYSADLSRSVPFTARVHVVDDYVKGVHSVSGQRLIVELPGPDARIAGRVVFDLETDEVLMETGRISVDEQICRHLYG